MLRDKSFNPGWRYITSKELPANMYRSGEVGLAAFLHIIFFPDNDKKVGTY